jgi:uncharacterized repeat protein (TIGR01451 family)
MIRKRPLALLIVILLVVTNLLQTFATDGEQQAAPPVATNENISFEEMDLTLDNRSTVPNAPTREQVSIIRFLDTQTNYLGGMGLDAAGKVWTWGYNAGGQLGAGLPRTNYFGGMRRVPFFVEHDITVIQIFGAYHTSFALDDQGRVYAWGEGGHGMTGQGNILGHNPTPQRVMGAIADRHIVKVVAGEGIDIRNAVFAICKDGDVFAWGYGGSNRIPGLPGGIHSTPVRISGFDHIPGVRDISAGTAHVLALDSEGNVWSGGTGAFGSLGHGNTNNVTGNLQRIDFFANNGLRVVNISANHYTSMAVTDDGRAWIWGRRFVAGTAGGDGYWENPGSGRMEWRWGSHNVQQHPTTPTQINFNLASSPWNDTPPRVAFVAAGAYVNYIVDVYGRMWYMGWNTFYGFATDGPLFPEVPIPAMGGRGGKHNVAVTDATMLRTMGDGSTQMNAFFGDGHVVAPVFSGVIRANTDNWLPAFNSFRDFGQWSGINDGLHPTIYDKQYMMVSPDIRHGGNLLPTPIDRITQAARHSHAYPLDEEGRRLVYVVREEDSGAPATISGNFYVAAESYTGPWIVNNSNTTSLPVGVGPQTSIPALRPEERGWIGLSVDLDTFDYTGNQLNDMPFVSGIDTFQSAIMVIDSSGNLYRQSLDGSGTVAWGWDWDARWHGQTAMSGFAAPPPRGQNMGLYDFYQYEMVFMRGAPRTGYPELRKTNEIDKIYLQPDEEGRTPTQDVDIRISIPPDFTCDQLNLEAFSEIRELRWVLVPWDEDCDNFASGHDFTREQFEEVWASSQEGYRGNMLSDEHTYRGRPGEVTIYDFTVDVPNNGRLWILGEENVYTLTRDFRVAYTFDNFYTPTTVQHRGVDVDDNTIIVYEPSDSNVTKRNVDPPNVRPAPPASNTIWGFPLDANGNVIPNPTFGFDRVRLERYNPLPGNLAELWEWVTPQAEFLDFNKDDTTLPKFKDTGNRLVPFVHTFYYEFIGEPGVEIEKSAEGNAVAGQTLTYTITVANTGNTVLTGLVVTDTLPTTLQNPSDLDIGGPGSGGFVGQVLTVNIPTLGIGQSTVITFVETVDPQRN